MWKPNLPLDEKPSHQPKVVISIRIPNVCLPGSHLTRTARVGEMFTLRKYAKATYNQQQYYSYYTDKSNLESYITHTHILSGIN